jgi:O-methyltransferase involved in polyketide biosynthesis
LLHDPHAAAFVDKGVHLRGLLMRARVSSAVRHALSALSNAVALRTMAVDQLVLRAVTGDGFSQVVTFRAAVDTRQARLRDSLQGPHARWLELDSPQALQLRAARLDPLADAPRPLARVPVALHDAPALAVRDALLDSAFDGRLPTLFVLERTGDLDEAALDVLLEATRIARPRRVVIAWRTPESTALDEPTLHETAASIAPSPRIRWSHEKLMAVCRQHGLGGTRAWTPAEQVRDLAPLLAGRRLVLCDNAAVLDGVVRTTT